MSSTLFLINWAPEAVTVTLNQGQLQPILATEARYSYYPYNDSVPRDASGPGAPGKWGDVNQLVVQPSGGGSSQIYNDLLDPEKAAPNTDLRLWIFPSFIVFSQLDDQLGEPVYPS